MSSIFSTAETRKRSKADERELERAEKKNYKDLRWAIERYPVNADEWQTLLTLHAKHGKEGGRQLAHQLIPMWSLCQERIPGGCPMPDEMWEQWKPASTQRTSTRKVRSDAGKRRDS